MTKNLPATKDDEVLSEAMAACLPQERNFVTLLLNECTSAADAAKRAGYGNEDGTSSAATYARIAYRLLGRDRVIAAIATESKKAIRSLGPEAVRGLREIVNDKGSKDRMRAIATVLDRIDPTQTNVSVTVEHKVDPLKTTLEYLAHLRKIGTPEEILIKEFGKAGLEYYSGLLAKEQVVDAEFTEIKTDPRLIAPDGKEW